MLERQRMVRVSHAEQVRELPEIVKELIRVLSLSFLQKREQVTEITAPVQQVELVVRCEMSGFTSRRKTFQVEQ